MVLAAGQNINYIIVISTQVQIRVSQTRHNEIIWNFWKNCNKDPIAWRV